LKVKGARRILFKSLFKYGCDLSKCHDLSRLTIKVPNLTVMATLIEALHAHSALLVTRCKNRFAEDANTDDAGGCGARFLGDSNKPFARSLAQGMLLDYHTVAVA
jgi:hypothetical protein